MNVMETPASLNEAAQHFSRFLRENGYPERILRVEDTDIVWDRRQLWVSARPTQKRRDGAFQRYAEGTRNGHGVLLHAFSELGGAALAAVVLPKDEDAAQRRLIPRGGLMLSVSTNKLSARLVTNRLTWLILSVRQKTSSQLFRDGYLGCS